MGIILDRLLLQSPSEELVFANEMPVSLLSSPLLSSPLSLSMNIYSEGEQCEEKQMTQRQLQCWKTIKKLHKIR